jgi:hypothetical protein
MYRIMAFVGAVLALGAGTARADLVGNILDELSVDDYRIYVEDLENLGTRYYGTPGNSQAARYISGALAATGLAVREQSFSYNGVVLDNIEASLIGRENPDDIYIIGAHFDSKSSRSLRDPTATDAPGAHDNATGTPANQALATVLSRYQFESTIRFVAFNAEEVGTFAGSQAYAADAFAAGDRILGMINLDMIGYTGGNANEDIDILGDDWLRRIFVDNVTSYTSLTARTWNHNDDSDQYWFKPDRYPGSASILAIEDPGWSIANTNPAYHTVGDSSDRLDYDFALQVTRASGASMIELAGLIPAQAPVPSALGLWVAALLVLARWRQVV